ncbi:hypothetical protein [Nocardia sp. CC227C]|uniref:hypothetical protein n=1 Tax=Nocardia sp. CC227C TaxID=3044562 RepID=UPI00278BF90C|nr:hypothetical protein [Nocardia sp. CC227C]
MADICTTIGERLAADRAAARARSCDDTLEEARAEIVGDILEAAEEWADKAEGWDGAEQYCNWRASVYQRILELLDEGLYGEGA